MLTSITPLGERGRGFRWGITLSFMLLGSTLGGAAAGLLLGLLGDATIGSATGATAEWRLYLLAGLLVTAFVIELGGAGEARDAGLRAHSGTSCGSRGRWDLK